LRPVTTNRCPNQQQFHGLNEFIKYSSFYDNNNFKNHAHHWSAHCRRNSRWNTQCNNNKNDSDVMSQSSYTTTNTNSSHPRYNYGNFCQQRSNWCHYNNMNNNSSNNNNKNNNNENNNNNRIMAEFVRDVTLPDRTYYPVDTVLTKIWRVRNNGNIEWGNKVELVFFKGNETLTLEKRYPVCNAKPGEEVDVSAVIKTPNKNGRYCTYFRLQHNNEFFGPRLWVDVFAVDEDHQTQNDDQSDNQSKTQSNDAFKLQQNQDLQMKNNNTQSCDLSNDQSNNTRTKNENENQTQLKSIYKSIVKEEKNQMKQEKIQKKKLKN